MADVAVIILTRDEQQHIARAIQSVKDIASEVHIVDSGSTDKTIEVAQELGAKTHFNTWVNHAVQFQWALENCEITAPWVMRLDADEYLTPELVDEIKQRLPGLAPEYNGVILKRRVMFMGKWIRYGGYYPIKLLRIWRRGTAAIEQKWMDEHIYLHEGKSIEFKHDFVDDNLNNLSWWTDKHNHYATREAIDNLNRQYDLFDQSTMNESTADGQQAARKRWMKNTLYARMPLFLRAFVYFNYRYWIQLGFLDGTKGLIWHVLQGFWYRFLVDAKTKQILERAANSNRSVAEVLKDDYKFETGK